jgi:hypothetical protein
MSFDLYSYFPLSRAETNLENFRRFSLLEIEEDSKDRNNLRGLEFDLQTMLNRRVRLV